MVAARDANGYLTKKNFWQLIAITAIQLLVAVIPTAIAWGKLTEEMKTVKQNQIAIKLLLDQTIERKKELERRIQRLEDEAVYEKEHGMRQTPEEKRRQIREWFNEWHHGDK